MLPNITSTPFFNDTANQQSANITFIKLGSIVIDHNHYQNPEQPHFNNRITLPVKQYSNKFLRECKPKSDMLYNHNILKPKKSLIFMRKQMKYRRNRNKKDKQNIIKYFKTSCSGLSSANASQSYLHSPVNTINTNPHQKNEIQQQLIAQNKIQKFATAQAIEMFNRIYNYSHNEQKKTRNKIFCTPPQYGRSKQITILDKCKIPKKPIIQLSNSNNEDKIFSESAKMNKICIDTKRRKKKCSQIQDLNFQLTGW